VKPTRMPAMPRPRAKMTRGRLPLQMVQRTKFGWACLRSEYSTVGMIERNAEGWVVFCRAWRTDCRSRADRLSSRGLPPAM